MPVPYAPPVTLVGEERTQLELRAAMSLSRLWHRQGKRTAALQLLGGIYAWFTEGFATGDLQEAKTVLEALRSERKSDSS